MFIFVVNYKDFKYMENKIDNINATDTKIRISLEAITDHMIENEFAIVGYMLDKPILGEVFRLYDKNLEETIFSTA